MEKQLEYFKIRDIIINFTQNNMVNVTVGLINVLSSTFAKDSNGVVNKPQMPAKEHLPRTTHSVAFTKENDANTVVVKVQYINTIFFLHSIIWTSTIFA